VYKYYCRWVGLEGGGREVRYFLEYRQRQIRTLKYSVSATSLLSGFRWGTSRCIGLLKEKDCFPSDSEARSLEEFVVVDMVEVTEERLIIVIEPKRASLGGVIKQYLLAIEDIKTTMAVVRCMDL